MVTFSVLPHVDTDTGPDALVFRTLTRMADEGRPLGDLCAVLREHMQIEDVIVCRPGSRPPDAPRVAVIPLFVETCYMADLYAILLPDTETFSVAAQLAVYAPIVARCVRDVN